MRNTESENRFVDIESDEDENVDESVLLGKMLYGAEDERGQIQRRIEELKLLEEFPSDGSAQRISREDQLRQQEKALGAVEKKIDDLREQLKKQKAKK